MLATGGTATPSSPPVVLAILPLTASKPVGAGSRQLGRPGSLVIDGLQYQSPSFSLRSAPRQFTDLQGGERHFTSTFGPLSGGWSCLGDSGSASGLSGAFSGGPELFIRCRPPFYLVRCRTFHRSVSLGLPSFVNCRGSTECQWDPASQGSPPWALVLRVTVGCYPDSGLRRELSFCASYSAMS